jgi:predicted Zn-dependent peptidase
LLAFGFVHAEFPTADWHATNLALKVLASGPESILQKKLVDTGLVSSLDYAVFTSAQRNLGMLFVRLAEGVTHEKIEALLHKELKNIDAKAVAKLIKKEKIKAVTSKVFSRSSSPGVDAELTEYVAADALAEFTTAATSIEKISAATVCKTINTLFDQNTLTTGYYRSV